MDRWGGRGQVLDRFVEQSCAGQWSTILRDQSDFRCSTRNLFRTTPFLIMINDLPDSVFNSIVSIFADDTRVTKVIKNEEDIEELQNDLNRVYEWQEKNNLLFNSKKIQILRHGGRRDLKENNYPKPSGTEAIEEKDVVTDLGVKFNNKADFSDHIDKVCSKTSQKSG